MLLGDQAFLIESIDASEGGVGKPRRRGGAFPLSLRSAHILLTHAAIEQVLARRGRGPGCLRLRHPRLDLRAVQGHEQRPRLHILSLSDVQLRDAPRDLRRDVDVARVDLPLKRRVHRPVGQVQSVEDEGDRREDRERHRDPLDAGSFRCIHGWSVTSARWTNSASERLSPLTSTSFESATTNS